MRRSASIFRASSEPSTSGQADIDIRASLAMTLGFLACCLMLVGTIFGTGYPLTK